MRQYVWTQTFIGLTDVNNKKYVLEYILLLCDWNTNEPFAVEGFFSTFQNYHSIFLSQSWQPQALLSQLFLRLYFFACVAIRPKSYTTEFDIWLLLFTYFVFCSLAFNRIETHSCMKRHIHVTPYLLHRESVCIHFCNNTSIQDMEIQKLSNVVFN